MNSKKVLCVYNSSWNCIIPLSNSGETLYFNHVNETYLVSLPGLSGSVHRLVDVCLTWRIGSRLWFSIILWTWQLTENKRCGIYQNLLKRKHSTLCEGIQDILCAAYFVTIWLQTLTVSSPGESIQFTVGWRPVWRTAGHMLFASIGLRTYRLSCKTVFNQKILRHGGIECKRYILHESIFFFNKQGNVKVYDWGVSN